jgi:hypothetical protein
MLEATAMLSAIGDVVPLEFGMTMHSSATLTLPALAFLAFGLAARVNEEETANRTVANKTDLRMIELLGKYNDTVAVSKECRRI